MKKKRILPAALFFFAAVLLAMDFMTPDRFFSAQENRKLQQKPDFSAEAVWNKSFMEEYEEYVADQFPGRDAFIAVKTGVLRLAGKKDINGVYFAPGRTLVERHTPESVDVQRAAQKRERMLKQAAQIQEKIPGKTVLMLVPSADAVQLWRLPAFSENFDQASWIGETVQKATETGMITVDVLGELKEHDREKIYYGTDHHWTTLGAFYGYQALAEALGMQQRSLSDYEQITVKNDFFGTLQAKVNLPVAPDEIEIFRRSGEEEHPVSFIYEETAADSCYFYEKLQTKDAYAFFLNGNYPLVEIEGEGPKEKTILLIKDSYANCFAPFLTGDFGTIVLIDPRYYRGDLTELVDQYEPEYVLYLYNVFQFINHYTLA